MAPPSLALLLNGAPRLVLTARQQASMLPGVACATSALSSAASPAATPHYSALGLGQRWLPALLGRVRLSSTGAADGPVEASAAASTQGGSAWKAFRDVPWQPLSASTVLC